MFCRDIYRSLVGEQNAIAKNPQDLCGQTLSTQEAVRRFAEKVGSGHSQQLVEEMYFLMSNMLKSPSFVGWFLGSNIGERLPVPSRPSWRSKSCARGLGQDCRQLSYDVDKRVKCLANVLLI